MKFALAILTAVLLLTGCGHAKDLFVGTWQNGPGGPKEVISSTAGGRYLLTEVSGRHADYVMKMSRHGDRLSGSFRVLKGANWRTAWTMTVTRLTGARLSFARVGDPADVVDFTKVSDNTAAPAPSPLPAASVSP